MTGRRVGPRESPGIGPGIVSVELVGVGYRIPAMTPATPDRIRAELVTVRAIVAFGSTTGGLGKRGGRAASAARRRACSST